MKFLIKMIILLAFLNQATTNLEGKLHILSEKFDVMNQLFAQNKSAAAHYSAMKNRSVDDEEKWVYDTLAFIKEMDNCSVELVRGISQNEGKGIGNAMKSHKSCLTRQGV